MTRRIAFAVVIAALLLPVVGASAASQPAGGLGGSFGENPDYCFAFWFQHDHLNKYLPMPGHGTMVESSNGNITVACHYQVDLKNPDVSGFAPLSEVCASPKLASLCLENGQVTVFSHAGEDCTYNYQNYGLTLTAHNGSMVMSPSGEGQMICHFQAR